MKENKPVIFTEKLNLLFQKELNKRELIWLRLTLEAQGLEASDHKTESIELHEEMAKFISNHWWGGPRNAPFNSWTDHEQWKQERNRSTCLNRFWQEVGTYLDQNFLDEKAFRWIEETGRQPNWISKQLSKLYRSYRTGMSTLPLEQQMLFRSHFIELSDKERLIARFDSWSTRSEEKLRTLKRLQHAWDEQLIGEQPFNWYGNPPIFNGR